MKLTTPLRKLMEAYCSRQGLQMDNLRFYTPDGERIMPDKTVQDVCESFFPPVLWVSCECVLAVVVVVVCVCGGYCWRQGLQMDNLRFYTPDGECIMPDKTVQDVCGFWFFP